MSSFVDNDLTNAGIALLTELELGASFEPTKIVMGSGYMPSGSTARTMTDVVAPEATLQISKWERSGTDKIVIGGVYSNEEITEPFYYRELGLYAKATKEDGTEVPECLYSYGNAGDTADLMTAYEAGSPVERVIDVVTYIGNDAEVNLTIESGVYIPMTQKGAAGGVAELDNTGKVPEDQLPSMDYIPTSEKGAANGVATLDENGKIPEEQLPDPDFDALCDLYGYEMNREKNSSTKTTITVTVDESAPVEAAVVAEIVKSKEAGTTTITVTQTIDDEVKKWQHVFEGTSGEGGPFNG